MRTAARQRALFIIACGWRCSGGALVVGCERAPVMLFVIRTKPFSCSRTARNRGEELPELVDRAHI
jgi:uncharacterized protein (DUF169 family)